MLQVLEAALLQYSTCWACLGPPCCL